MRPSRRRRCDRAPGTSAKAPLATNRAHRLAAVSLHLFAGLRVRDYGVALTWYDKLLGPPTFFPHQTEAVWTVAEDRSVYVVEHGAGAGGGVVLLFVADLDGTLAQIAQRGLQPDEVEIPTEGVRKAVYRDLTATSSASAGRCDRTRTNRPSVANPMASPRTAGTGCTDLVRAGVPVSGSQRENVRTYPGPIQRRISDSRNRMAV
jgi:hypothetical protein